MFCVYSKLTRASKPWSGRTMCGGSVAWNFGISMAATMLREQAEIHCMTNRMTAQTSIHSGPVCLDLTSGILVRCSDNIHGKYLISTAIGWFASSLPYNGRLIRFTIHLTPYDQEASIVDRFKILARELSISNTLGSSLEATINIGHHSPFAGFGIDLFRPKNHWRSDTMIFLRMHN